MATTKPHGHQGATMSPSEAGKIGGDKILKERGPQFYSEIGSQQGKANNPGNFANRPKSEVKKAGEAGGHNSHRASAS